MHGDGKSAVNTAKRIKQGLTKSKIILKPFESIKKICLTLKTLIERKLKSVNFYKLFKPQLSPKKMLELGVFGGSYFSGNTKEYPKTWFKNAKLSKTFNAKKKSF